MYVETLMVNSETLKTFGYQLTGTDAAGFRCSRVESRPSYCKSDRFLERGLALGFRVFDKVTLSVSGLCSSTHINMYLNYIIYYLIFYSISLFNMVIRVATLPSLSYIASLVSCASPWCAATPPPPPLTAAIAIPRGLSTLGLTSFRCGPIPGGGGGGALPRLLF
jgi:hypothetical protein